MARVKRAVNAHKKRRVILERASGYRGQRSRLYRKAKEQVTHSLVYAYRDRRKPEHSLSDIMSNGMNVLEHNSKSVTSHIFNTLDIIVQFVASTRWPLGISD